jgi:hypothetical protein
MNRGVLEMKIRIIGSNPRNGELGIDELIGQEFEVQKKDDEGYWIESESVGKYRINPDECEVIR